LFLLPCRRENVGWNEGNRLTTLTLDPS
jgi:hypothetical protein